MTTQVSPLPGGIVLATPTPTTNSVIPLPGGVVVVAPYVSTVQGQGVISMTIVTA